MAKDRAAIGKFSRAKGARAEREVANLFSARGFKAMRGCQHKGGINSPDVLVEALAEEFHFEVKFVEALNIYKAMRQAEIDGGCNKVPAVIHKRSRENWKVTMDLNRFIDMLQLIYDRVDWANQLSGSCEEGIYLL